MYMYRWHRRLPTFSSSSSSSLLSSSSATAAYVTLPLRQQQLYPRQELLLSYEDPNRTTTRSAASWTCHYPHSTTTFFAQPSTQVGRRIPRRSDRTCHWRSSSSSSSSASASTISPSLSDLEDLRKKVRKQIYSTIPDNGHGVQVGQYAILRRTYNNSSQKDVNIFTNIVQDYNPIHSDTVLSELMSSSTTTTTTTTTNTDDDDDDENENDNDDNNENCSKDQHSAVFQSYPALEIHTRDGGLLQQVSSSSPSSSSSKHARNDNKDNTTINVIIPGMLVGSIFSSILGCLVPGCVYINQSLEFKSPIYTNDTIEGKINITRIRRPFKKRSTMGSGIIIQCTTTVSKITNDDSIVPTNEEKYHEKKENGPSSSSSSDVLAITGSANVWLPNGFAIQ